MNNPPAGTTYVITVTDEQAKTLEPCLNRFGNIILNDNFVTALNDRRLDVQTFAPGEYEGAVTKEMVSLVGELAKWLRIAPTETELRYAQRLEHAFAHILNPPKVEKGECVRRIDERFCAPPHLIDSNSLEGKTFHGLRDLAYAIDTLLDHIWSRGCAKEDRAASVEIEYIKSAINEKIARETRSRGEGER